MTLLAALIVAQAPLFELPFEHRPGRIWLKATLNGQPVEAILDSGAAGIFAMEGPAARANGVKGAPSSGMGLGEKSLKIWSASGLELGLGGMAMRVPYILAPAYKTPPSRSIDVAVGFDLFMRYAVEVNYLDSKVRLHRPWTYRPPEGFTTLRAEFADRSAIVDADLFIPGLGERHVKARLDTGAPIGIEISRKMALREGLDDLLKNVPIEDTPGGFSGGTQARWTRGIRCRLAGQELTTPSRVTMTDGGISGIRSDYDVLIGDDVLKHFDLVFHYWRGRVYLRPNGT